MKKAFLMAAILTAVSITAVSFTACGSAPRTMTATKTEKPEMACVSAEIAKAEAFIAATEATTEAKTTEAKPKATTTAAEDTAAVTVSTEPTTEVTKAAVKAATTTAVTAPAAAKETTTVTTASCDADFRWFGSGVYKVSVAGSERETYYIFNDDHNGRVNSVSGIDIGFTYEQSRSGVVFHMADDQDPIVMLIDNAGDDAFTGTMLGNAYTFSLVNGADPAAFVAADQVIVDQSDREAQIQACDDGQNPVMNFIGSYSNGRASMTVSAMGKDQAVITISWGSSAFETVKWEISGTVMQDEDMVVLNYQNCTCENIIFNEDSSLYQDVTAYTNGAGTIRFGGNMAVWNDEQVGSAEKQIFCYTNG